MVKRTCLDCGFLTIQDFELYRTDRIELGTLLGKEGQSASMSAHPEQTWCSKNIWTYDLAYSRDCLDGVKEELGESRDNCRGFFPYEPGFTPEQHLEKQEEHQREQRREKSQRKIAWIGFGGALLGGLLGGLGGIVLLQLLK